MFTTMKAKWIKTKNNQKPSDALSQKQVHGIRLLHNKHFFG
jgi:hypothetical protein